MTEFVEDPTDPLRRSIGVVREGEEREVVVLTVGLELLVLVAKLCWWILILIILMGVYHHN